MTKKLYDQDAYQIEFHAVVEQCTSVKKKDYTKYQVVLDQTLFFPEEGGQSPDQGYIDNKEVIDVQIKDNIIIHTLKEPLVVGSKVHGVIAWEHRFNNMQQHSGEHIFSGLVHQQYGYDNVGFHLSNQIVTMDFNGVLTPIQAAEIERKANEVIIRNLPIEVTFPLKKELATLEYRSKIEIEGQVRIVTIPGVDVCACCAPHVHYTREIGLLKIMSLQNYKGGVRISILCGYRALEDYREKVKVIAELSVALSSNQENLVGAVNRIKEETQSLKQELYATKQAFLETKISQIPKSKEDVLLFENNLDTLTMRNGVNRLVSEHTGVCGIFSGLDREGYKFILASKEKDIRQVMAILKEVLDARGGGSAAMVQGSVSARKEDIIAAIHDGMA